MRPDSAEGADADPKKFTQGRRTNMKLNSLARISLAAIVALVPVTLPAQDKVTVQQVALEKESFELIAQTEDVARSVHYNTDALRMHASRNLSRQTHHHHLTQVKDLINERLNPALTRLAEIKPQLPVWEQGSIDKMLISARDLATDTNSAFMRLNEKSGIPIMLNNEYRAFLDTMDEHAKKLVSMADATGDYADALDRILEVGLEVPKHT